MQQIDINEAKHHLGDFIDFALNGEDIIITKDNQPILKLASTQLPKFNRKAGSAKGLVTLSDDFDEALDDFKQYR